MLHGVPRRFLRIENEDGDQVVMWEAFPMSDPVLAGLRGRVDTAGLMVEVIAQPKCCVLVFSAPQSEPWV